jgi:hypothetical protein
MEFADGPIDRRACIRFSYIHGELKSVQYALDLFLFLGYDLQTGPRSSKADICS